MKLLRVIPLCRLLLPGLFWLQSPAAGSDNGETPPTVIGARQIAALALAHDDPLTAVAKKAEDFLEERYSQRRVVLSQPEHGSLPAWIAAVEERHKPLILPRDDDFAGWAGLLNASEYPEPKTVLEHLANPRARTFAPQVAALLKSGKDGPVDEAVSTLTKMGAKEFAKKIAELLRSPTDYINENNVVDALWTLTPEESAPWLVELLPAIDSDVAYWAAKAIGDLNARGFADALIPLINSEERSVRTAALESLGKLCDPRCIEPAVAALDAGELLPALWILADQGNIAYPTLAAALQFPDPGAKVEALETIAKTGIRILAPEVAELLSNEQESGVRRQTIATLAALNASEFSDRIATQLQDTEVSFQAVVALGKLKAVKHIPEITKLRDTADSVSLRAECVQTLLTLGGMTSVEANRYLSSLLDKSPEKAGDEYSWLLGMLAKAGATESVEAVLRFMGKETERSSGFFVGVESLHDFGFDSQAQLLANFLDSEEASVRIGCLRYLDWLHAGECSPQIVPLLDPREPKEVRIAAIQCLLSAGDRDAGPKLAELLNSSEPDEIRKEVLWSLRYNKGRRKVEPAAAVARDAAASEELRAAAIGVIAAAGGFAAESILIEFLHRDVPRPLRVYALRGISELSAKSAAPAVSAMLDDSDPELVWEALETLRHLEAHNFSDAVAAVLAHDNELVRREAAYTLEEFGVRRHAGAMLSCEEERIRLRGISLLKSPVSEREAALLFTILLDSNGTLRRAAAAALAEAGELHTNRGLAWCAEAALRDFEFRSNALLAAHALYYDNPVMRPAVLWVGSRAHTERPQLPQDRTAAIEILEALRKVHTEAAAEKLSRALFESGSVSAEIIAAAEWDSSDAAWLAGMAEELSRYPDLKQKAAAVQLVADAARERDPLRRLGRAGLWAFALQPFVWVLVLLVYPWSRLAQWMVWSRGVRRVLGLGWVEPVVLRVPWLRERMWRPFREALVPPGEVVTFDEWTFFDAVRMKPADGGETRAALPVLAQLRGVAVLRGASGLGKTTLLQALAATSPRPSALLRAAECGEGLLAALRARLPRHARNDAAFLRALVLRGSPDIFVDAVHESLPEVQARLSEEVSALPGANVLLTTQPSNWQPPPGAPVWDLQPLRAQDIAPFLLNQGTAAVEAAGAGSLAERQRAFTERAQTFLNELEKLPPEDVRGAALRRMLGNPMEAVLAAELLAACQSPDPARLLAQRMEHLEEDYAAQQGEAFPAKPFAEHLLSWRRSGAPLLRLELFEKAATFLARHRLLRKNSEGDGWRFRHDKILDWFLRPVLPGS